MSIRVMNRVWEHSHHKEGTLLVLLALADYADDNGVCWPAQPEIAQKARLTDRQVRNVIDTLEESGELVYRPGRGRGRPAVYCILAGLADSDREQKRKWFHGKYFQENSSAFSEEKRKLATIKAEIGDNKSGNDTHTKYPTNSAAESAEPAQAKNDNRHDPSWDPSKDLKNGSDHVDPPARALSELALTIADVCKINPKVAIKKQKDGLNATYQALKAIEATPADVRARERWWYANDWRAKKENRPPRPEELQEIWEMVKVPTKAVIKRAAESVEHARRSLAGFATRVSSLNWPDERNIIDQD